MARARQILQGDGFCDTRLNINSTEVTIWQLISFKCSLLQEKSYLTLAQTNYKHILKDMCVISYWNILTIYKKDNEKQINSISKKNRFITEIFFFGYR